MNLSSNVPKKRDSVCVSIRSLCSKTILVESHYSNAFSMLFKGISLFQKVCFSIDAFALCCHRVFSFIAISTPIH